MLNLALLLVLAADPDGGCVFKPSKEPPKIEDTGSGVEVTFSFDPNAFRCAKKAGGKLELVWSVGQGGELAAMPAVAQTGYSARESVRDLCKTPGLKQIQAQLKGSGEMEKLDWSSSVVEYYCERCQWSGDDNGLALHTKGNLTPAGSYTIDARFDPTWYACAQKDSALELRVFTGETAADVNKANEPTHVVKGLTGPKVKKSFSKAAICKGNPKFVGVEFGGTGEFRVLAPKGRTLQASNCQ